MRPIIKGDWPTDAAGAKIQFNGWGEAKPYLIDNTGLFCHFCEMKLDNTPAVEHVKPKALKHSPNLQNHWANLMLICDYCNSRKTKAQIKLYDYYWPHKNNTFKALNMDMTGIIKVNDGLVSPQLDKAENIIELYGLDKTTDTAGGMDARLRARLEAMSKAINRLLEYQAGQATVQAIVDNASSSGFWSVWFRMFKNHPVVLNALLNDFHFRGTATACFDAANNYTPQDRNATDF